MAPRTGRRPARLLTAELPARSTALPLYVAAGALAAILVYAVTLGTLPMLVAVGAAVFVAMLACFGSERIGLLLLIVAFFTAPMYKGLAPSPGSPVTTTDLLFVAAFGLLVPQLLGGRVRLPTLYFAGVGLVFSTGLVASVFSADPLTSLVSLAFWMMVMLGLPVAFALLAPSGRLVDLLAAAFVVGQIFSMFYGLARGYSEAGRHAGFSTHPNYFAQAGMLSLALLLYLAYRHRGRAMLLILPATVLCATSVVLSGSRAATVVVAVLVMMVPVVERSAVTGFLLAAVGALGLLLLPVIAGMAGEGSSISRLGGDTSARFSNSARSLGLEEGIDRFFAHPFRGTGLIELYEIHNNFLEVAVAIGIFGLVGYLMVLYSFARPILSLGEYRRLAYGVWAYVGFGATVPSLYDRSIWAVVALSVVAMIEHERRRLGTPEDAGGPGDPSLAVHAPGRTPTARLLPTPSKRSPSKRAGVHT